MNLTERIQQVGQPQRIPRDVAENVFEGTLLSINKVKHQVVDSEYNCGRLWMRWQKAMHKLADEHEVNRLEREYKSARRENGQLRQMLQHFRDTLALVEPYAFPD
jgi:hypothetical protein